MLIYQGKSVYGGIAIGKIKIWKKADSIIKCYHVKDADKEFSRFIAAKSKAINQLSELRKQAIEKVGSESAAIFEIHAIMLEDADFSDSIENMIRNQHYNAEYAVSLCCESFVAMFSSMDDSYMKERAADVKDISERLINILSGVSFKSEEEESNLIMVAEDFSPSETLQLDKSKILAFVTAKGSLNSHTAILARMMNIPAIIGVDLCSNGLSDGKVAIVDGYSGTVYVDPDEGFLKKMQQKADEDAAKHNLLKFYKGKETVTIDGKRINLYANIGNITDIANVIDNDAEGIGLFRSEFIFLEKNTFPSEEEQFAIYKNAVETMCGKKVIIRTLDIGADKKVDYFGLKHEENPAMGLRAIRLCLKQPHIFKTQLRALMRASVYGNLSIMYPMITSVEEIKQIKDIINETAEELKTSNIPYSIPEQGIMIETPASVMISDLLANEVSFFSIGTNDLSQYALAIDRQNEDVDDFFNPHHEAIMRMIELTVKNGHKAGIWVGICGELASDITLTKKFLAMGIDELSVSPAAIFPIRKTVRETKL